MDCENYSYWNALGVISMNKGYSMHPHFCGWIFHFSINIINTTTLDWSLSEEQTQFLSCHILSVISGLENFALAQHCFIKSIQVEPNVGTAHLVWWWKAFSENNLMFLLTLYYLITECGCLDKPWYPLFEEGQYRGLCVWDEFPHIICVSIMAGLHFQY